MEVNTSNHHEETQNNIHEGIDLDSWKNCKIIFRTDPYAKQLHGQILRWLDEGMTQKEVATKLHKEGIRTLNSLRISGATVSNFVRELSGVVPVPRKQKAEKNKVQTEKPRPKRAEVVLERTHNQTHQLRLEPVENSRAEAAKNLFFYTDEIRRWDLPDNIKNECAFIISKYFSGVE